MCVFVHWPAMKFTVTCLVSSVNSSLLRNEEAVTKEIVVANPRATVQNLRATVAIQFRLNVVAFNFRFDHRPSTDDKSATHDAPAPPSSASPSSSSTAAAVDFTDEKKLLTECGLEDGDCLTVVPKNYQAPTAVTTAATAAGSNVDAVSASAAGENDITAEADGNAAKKPRTEGGAKDFAEADEEESLGLDDEEEEEEDGDDVDSDDAEASAQNDLFEALRDVVPDLTVLRQEFLANPQAVMERIERNHPSLFQVITQNQETFINLMNNEELTKVAQSMLHGGLALGEDGDDSLGWSMGEEDEEMDEETEAQMNALFHNYIVGGDDGDGDFDAEDLAALEASGMQVDDVDGDEGEGDGAKTAGDGRVRKSEKDFILSRVPSEEDEKKIQTLTELGFSYEQCKLAFYMCHRSIDRASNMLFEAPPEL